MPSPVTAPPRVMVFSCGTTSGIRPCGKVAATRCLVGAHALHVGGAGDRVDRDHPVQTGHVQARRPARGRAAGTGSRCAWPAAPAARRDGGVGARAARPTAAACAGSSGACHRRSAYPSDSSSGERPVYGSPTPAARRPGRQACRPRRRAGADRSTMPPVRSPVVNEARIASAASPAIRFGIRRADSPPVTISSLRSAGETASSTGAGCRRPACRTSPRRVARDVRAQRPT